MSFLKNKTFWAMLFVALSGVVLRLLFIDKPEGLWNDEYVSWQVASIPMGKEFWRAVILQCHMPFYYLYLKFFMHFFGQSDLLLRLTSFLPGILSIFAMYFAGKELKDAKTGVFCALITSISSFLIYFSQEVRFYELLFFFSSLALLSSLKLIKNKSSAAAISFVISNFLILFTHTIGFVFVFFNLVFVLSMLKKADSRQKSAVLWGTSIVFAFLFPLVLSIFTTPSFSQWWGHFTFSKIAFLFTDYFSPILINLVNAPDSFLSLFSVSFFIFALIPVLIIIFAFIEALKTKKPEISGLSLICVAVMFTLALAAMGGKLVFLTKYSIEIYPILILIAGFGFSQIKGIFVRNFLIISFCALNLFYLLLSPDSAIRRTRREGHKIVADLIRHAGAQKGDIIILNYYDQARFEKYFDFNDYKVVSFNKGNFPQYISNSDYEDVLKNGKKLYRGIFSASDNEFFEKKFRSEVTNELKSGHKVLVVVLNSVSMYSPMQLQKVAEDEKTYQKAPFLFLVFSYLKNQTIKIGLKELKVARIESSGNWSVITLNKT